MKNIIMHNLWQFSGNNKVIFYLVHMLGDDLFYLVRMYQSQRESPHAELVSNLMG